MRIGMKRVAAKALAPRMKVSPSITGMLRSVTIRSGERLSSFFSASAPSSASTTSNCASRRVNETICRMVTESSTIRTFLGMGGLGWRNRKGLLSHWKIFRQSRQFQILTHPWVVLIDHYPRPALGQRFTKHKQNLKNAGIDMLRFAPINRHFPSDLRLRKFLF